METAFVESAAAGVRNAGVMFGAVAEVRIPVTPMESVVAVPILVKLRERTAVAVSPAVIAAVPEEILNVAPVWIAAFDGPEANTPNPSAATTASAIRLKLVLLDICFLSIVVTRTIPVAALR